MSILQNISCESDSSEEEMPVATVVHRICPYEDEPLAGLSSERQVKTSTKLMKAVYPTILEKRHFKKIPLGDWYRAI